MTTVKLNMKEDGEEMADVLSGEFGNTAKCKFEHRI